MEKKKFLFLGVGVILIVAAGFLLLNKGGSENIPLPPQQSMGDYSAQPAQPAYSMIVVASQDITKNAVITPDMVKEKKVPGSTTLDGDMESKDAVIGKIATSDIVVGEKITRDKISVRPDVQKLSAKIPDGYRAVTIPIEKLASLEGMIHPEDKVDIIGTFPFTQNMGGQSVTQQGLVPRFENVEILAVGNVILPFQQVANYGSITLALSPEESSLLLYAIQMGKIRLLLRSPEDTSVSRQRLPVTTEVLWQKLLAISQQQQQQYQQQQPPEQQPVAPAVQEKPRVEIFVGGSNKTQK